MQTSERCEIFKRLPLRELSLDATESSIYQAIWGKSMRRKREILWFIVLLSMGAAGAGFSLCQAPASADTGVAASTPPADSAQPADSVRWTRQKQCPKRRSIWFLREPRCCFRSQRNQHQERQSGRRRLPRLTFPVVVGSRVMIPAGVYVQGVVDRVARAGRIKGRQRNLIFTSLQSFFRMARSSRFPELSTACPARRTEPSRAMKAPSSKIRTRAATSQGRPRSASKEPESAPSAESATGHPP